MDYRLGLVPPEEAVRVYNFIKGKSLDYPGYMDWVEKCRRQLELGEKEALAVSLDGVVLGSIVFQALKRDRLILEVKNFRVSEEHKGIGIGSSLDSSLLTLARLKGFRRIQIDTHTDNSEMIEFLIKRGYVAQSQENLYDPTKQEIIFVKEV